MDWKKQLLGAGRAKAGGSYLRKQQSILCDETRPAGNAEDIPPDSARSHRCLKTPTVCSALSQSTKQQRRWSLHSLQCYSDTRTGASTIHPMSPMASTFSPPSLSIIRDVYSLPTICRPWPQATALARGAARALIVAGGRESPDVPPPILRGPEQEKSDPVGERNKRGLEGAEIRRAGSAGIPRVPCQQSQPSNPHSPIGFPMLPD